MTSIPLRVLTGDGVGKRQGTHPCYDADAHLRFARLHLPVAPGCNIQCNYCNRKFDCSNESRPGVTTALLSPEQALEKVARVRAEIDNLTVVAVAGPGEPLANAGRTLRTLELVKKHHPDLSLCLSTNGLNLLDHLFRIERLGIGHLTVTINTLDPEVAARIYPWITFGGRRYEGVEGARILIERQLDGLQDAIDRGLRCKVNSVMIPGVNDEQLPELSRRVASMGAAVHNVMPLVSAPEHGTYYGLTGQRGPTDAELADVRARCDAVGEECGADMTVMRHCRSCRADAVGLLDDDRGGEFSAPRPASGGGPVPAPRTVPGGPVRVAVATSEGVLVDEHFGRVEEFSVYESDGSAVRFVDSRSVARYCSGKSTCGAEVSAADTIAEMLADCAVLLCTKAGAGPTRTLAAAGIEVVHVYERVETAVAAAAARIAAGPAGTATGALTDRGEATG